MYLYQLIISGHHFWVDATSASFFFKTLFTTYESNFKTKGAPIALWYVYVQITNESVNGVYYNNFRYGCLACCALQQYTQVGFVMNLFGLEKGTHLKKMSMYLLEVGNFDPCFLTVFVKL